MPPCLSKLPVHWILDWSGTITKRDTLDALVGIATTSKPESPILQQWEQVKQAYYDDYSATLDGLMLDTKQSTTIEQEKQLLKQLKQVEQRSLDRVFASEMFTGVTPEQLHCGAKLAVETKQLELRPGLVGFLQRVRRRGDKLNILSVSWSLSFNHTCLMTAGLSLDPEAILSNELDNIIRGQPSTGRIISDKDSLLLSSHDKLDAFEHLKTSFKGEKKPSTVVYIGDSWTDIECLLAADLGVCLRDDPMSHSQMQLKMALDRLKIDCPRLTEQSDSLQSEVVWSGEFHELRALSESM